MIIYGNRNKQLLGDDVMDKCEHCGNDSSMEMHVFRRYFHLFWIPFVPTKKFGISQCNHCKQMLKDSEMPPKLKASYNAYQANAKTPWWMYSGLVLFSLLVLSVMWSNSNDTKNNQAYFEKPQVGDVYQIKTETNNYTLYKIDEIKKDSIIFEINNFESNRVSGLRKLANKENGGFDGIKEGYSKQEVIAMKEKGRIEKIVR